MQVVITDANIFIDLQDIGLLKAFFKLGFEVSTTSFVLQEIEDEWSKVVKKEAKIISPSMDELEAISEMSLSTGFSYTDKTILYYAQQNGMLVLTGEKRMKTWCAENDIDCHGILYVLEEMVRTKRLTPSQAAQKLALLLTYNQWLPTGLCQDLIEKWSTE